MVLTCQMQDMKVSMRWYILYVSMIIIIAVVGIWNMKPQLNDLMERIAIRIPAKWEEVGYALGIKREHMEHIKSETIRLSSTVTSYHEVFSHWLCHELEQCTWTTVLTALATRQVGEGQLARRIRQDLLKRCHN